MNTITGQQVMTGNESNWRLSRTFLKTDSTVFVGFMALKSVVQNHLVGSKKRLSHDETLAGISFTDILPGPKAVKAVAYAEFKINGVSGAEVCATVVTIPAFLLLLIFSYVYYTWDEISAVNKIFKGSIPAVAVVIVHAVIIMRSNSIKIFKRLYTYKKNNNYAYLTQHYI